MSTPTLLSISVGLLIVAALAMTHGQAYEQGLKDGAAKEYSRGYLDCRHEIERGKNE